MFPTQVKDAVVTDTITCHGRTAFDAFLNEAAMLNIGIQPVPPEW
jgi:hypothetical protein